MPYVITIGYLIVAAFLFRPFTRRAIEATRIGKLTWGDVVFGIIIGLLATCAWPLSAPFLAIVSFMDNPTRAARIIGGESREDRMERLERERAEREQYIARLERELHIGTRA